MKKAKNENAGFGPGNLRGNEMNNSEPIITEQIVFVKDESRGITIRRGKHDKEHPYVHVSKAMIRDKNLSIKEKGALIFLLSLPDNWVTYPRQVAEVLGIGKDQMYSILKSLIRAGYATKNNQRSGTGEFTSVVYCFFEEKLEHPQIIKEKSTVSENPDTENPDPDNPDPVNQTLLKKDSTDKIPNTLLKVPEEPEKRVEKISPESFSSEVLETGQLMIEAMRIVKPDYAAANGKLLGILNEIDRMIRLDKRTPEKIIEVFRWALADNFWADKMFKPNPAKYLRDKFDQLEMKMNSKSPEMPIEKKAIEKTKPTLTQRIKGRYNYTVEFGNIVFTSVTGYFGGKIPSNDPEALEDWLKDKGL